MQTFVPADAMGSAAPCAPSDNLMAALDLALQAWASGHWAQAARLFTPDGVLRTSWHSPASGPSAIAAVLSEAVHPGITTVVRSTNRYGASDQREGVLSAYVYGTCSGNEGTALFGATLTGVLRADEGAWRWADLALAINWYEGDVALIPGSLAPAGMLGWQAGAASPVIVSELDSPGQGLPAIALAGTPAQQLAETFVRYAWAIDQGDFALLAGCFTADAQGAFPPMGTLVGRHAIVGQLKAFRRQWPWMQHFGVPLATTFDVPGTTAHLLVGRVMPQRDVTPEGQALYGACYDLTLRREEKQWRIALFDYRAGWMTAPR